MRHFILVVGGFLLALPLFGQENSSQLKRLEGQVQLQHWHAARIEFEGKEGRP
jgi:hypothetical protein